jgi:hypothetical protein
MKMKNGWSIISFLFEDIADKVISDIFSYGQNKTSKGQENSKPKTENEIEDLGYAIVVDENGKEI